MKKNLALIVFGVFIELLFILYQLIGTNPAQTVIKYMVIFSTAFVLLIVIYLIIKKETFSTRDILLVISFAFLFQLTLLFSAPEMSNDIYRYVWDGKLQHFNINPFTYAPDDPRLNAYHSKELPGRVNFPEIKTIYPPLSQILFRLSYFLFGESVSGMKFLFILFQVGACLVFYLLLVERGQNPSLLLFFAWNPLVIMETAVNGHLDIVMVFFLLLSLLFFYRQRYILSGISFAGGVLSKLIPIILLPLFFLNLLNQKFLQGPGTVFSKRVPGRRRQLRRSGSFLISFLLTIVVFYAFYWESAFNMFLTAVNYSSKWYFNNPIFSFILMLTKNNPLAHLISFSVFSVVFLFIFFSSLSFERKVFYTAFAFILLNPTIHPWYLIVLVGLLCIDRLDGVILWSGLVIFSYTVVYRFKLTGEWSDSWLQMVLQYTPLLIFVLIEFKIKKLYTTSLYRDQNENKSCRH